VALPPLPRTCSTAYQLPSSALFARSDRLILASPTVAAAVAFAIAISAIIAFLVERTRRRTTVRELERRAATIDHLTVDVTSLRSVLQEYIQQREAAEEVLRRGEERYRALVDNLTTVVFQVDQELRWTFLNSAWETVTGRSPAESIGQLAMVSMVEEDAGECRTILRELLDGVRSLGEQVVRVRCVAGNVHWLELRAIPMLDLNGTIVGVSGTLSDVTSRVSVEVELRRQQTLYRLIAENSSDIIALVALHGGRFTYVSPSTEHVLGYAADDILGVEWWTLLDPADREVITSAVQSVRAREPVTETVRVRKKDGSWVWIEATADAVLEEDGTVVGYRITARDFTEHRAASEALKESEAKYRLLAESIDDIVCLQDLDGTALYYSASTEKALGFTPSELLGKDVFALTHPDDLARLAGDAYLAVLRGETPLVEWRCLRKDGTYIWVETHTALLRNESGVPDRLLSVTRDIEGRKQAQEALRQSEERMRALIARAAYGIFRSTREGRFLDVNPALVTMLGYDSAEELLAIDIMRDMYLDAEERDGWMTAIDSGAHPEWFDLTWRRKDGTPIAVRLSARAARDGYGDVVWYEGIAENVTERLRREAVVRRAERMASLGHTLAGVAHELNNPLAAISGFAQILLKTHLPKDDRSAIETIHREAKRAAKIVKDLLTFARRQDSSERHRVDLNDIVRYIADTQRYAMETHGVLCELVLSEDPAWVSADPAQLEQVMLNLLVNARQALEAMTAPVAAGRIRAGASRTPMIVIRTSVRNNNVTLEISDNGPGIAAGELPRIWDPFWTTKEEGEGTGLGLSVVHGIVTEHGGSIDVETRVDSGTTFAVSLPLLGRDGLDGMMAIETMPPAPTSQRADRPLDILVVDDEEVIVGLLVRYFSSRGHAVMPAHEGHQALRVAERSSFDVVICDLRMPGMDGAELIRRLKELPTCSNARFILSTGDTATPAVRQRIDGLALAAVVDKPYEVEALRRIVEDD
jgi:two-component system, cell cycle sensor histidine kinase and response regulator CckA